jgi:hypothetical protein
MLNGLDDLRHGEGGQRRDRVMDVLDLQTGHGHGVGPGATSASVSR